MSEREKNQPFFIVGADRSIGHDAAETDDERTSPLARPPGVVVPIRSNGRTAIKCTLTSEQQEIEFRTIAKHRNTIDGKIGR